MLFLAGCRRHATGPSAEIRVVDTVPDADDIRFYVSNRSPLGTTLYGAASNYVKIPTGAYSVKVAAEKDGSIISYFAPLELQAEEQHRYTGIAVGNALSWPHAKVVVFDDEESENIDDGRASVSVIDAYPHSIKVDVIVNNVVAFHSLSFGARSKSLLLQGGPCEIKVIEAGTYFDSMAGPLPTQLEPGKSYLLVVLGPDTANQPGLVLLPDDDISAK